MTLYNATASGQVVDGPNLLTQIYVPAGRGRLRLHGWDVSFQGLIAGNNMKIAIYDSTASGGLEYVEAAILDGESKFVSFATRPLFSQGFLSVPTPVNKLDSVHLADSAFYKKQYGKWREPMTVRRLNITCEPSDLQVPVSFKANLTFSL